DAILDALSMTKADLFERKSSREYTVIAEYDYTDEQGELQYVVERRPGKKFLQRRPDGNGGWTWNLTGVRRVPYRLPELLDGVRAERWVLIPEGEKDVLKLAANGFVATCNSGGAGKWRKDWTPMFTGAKVAVIPDNDEPGWKHAATVAELLSEVADVRIV